MLLFRKEVRYNAAAAMIALIIKMDVVAILFAMVVRGGSLCPGFCVQLRGMKWRPRRRSADDIASPP